MDAVPAVAVPAIGAPANAQLAYERRVLLYTPLWILALVLVTLSGRLPHLGDAGHLALGFGLALPLWLLPLWPGPGERAVPLRARYATQALLFVTLLAFLQNYFGAVLFFRTLGMRYHFATSVLLNGTPFFLYPLTVAYFALYYVVLERARRAAAGAPPALRFAWLLLTCYGTAFAETFVMANDALRPFFSYADKGFTLRVGSLCYGTLFLFSAPVYERLARLTHRRGDLLRTAAAALAANTLIMVAYEVYMRALGTPYPAP